MMAILTNPQFYMAAAAALTGAATLAIYNYSQNQVTGRTLDTLSDEAREKIQATYAYMVGGLSLTAASAYASHLAGLSVRILTAQTPWLCALSTLTTFVALGAIQYLPQDQEAARTMSWGLFNAAFGLMLSPLCYVHPKILFQAGMITGATTGSISILAAYAKNQRFLQFEAPLMAGLFTITCMTTAAAFFPASAFATIAMNVSTYGGLAIYCGLVAIDTRKMIAAAKTNPQFDPMHHSVGLYLDNLGIFLKVLRIFLEQEAKKKMKTT
jgi:FtsH-binding integral membrane protein